MGLNVKPVNRIFLLLSCILEVPNHWLHVMVRWNRKGNGYRCPFIVRNGSPMPLETG